jgi:hypothetical protein
LRWRGTFIPREALPRRAEGTDTQRSLVEVNIMFLLAGNTGGKDRVLLEASTEQGHFLPPRGTASGEQENLQFTIRQF